MSNQRDTHTPTSRPAQCMPSELRRFIVPSDPQSSSGRGPAATLHLLPSAGDCRRVVLAAEDENPGGYYIHIPHLQTNVGDWVTLLEAKDQQGPMPVVAMVQDALDNSLRPAVAPLGESG